MTGAASTLRPLTRSLGTLGVLFLTLSITTPASSVFVIVPGILQVAGTGAVWALALAAIVSIATAFVYAELSSTWPVVGGEYVFVGLTLGPAAGFVMLVVNLISNLLIVPVLALGTGAIADQLWPGLPAVPTALAVIAASTALSVLNIRVNAIVTGIFLAIELLALLILTWFGAASPARDVAAFLHPMMPTAAGLTPTSIAAFGTATSIAVFALNGPGSAVYFGEDMHRARERIAHAILAASILGTVAIATPTLTGLAGAPDLRWFLISADPFGALVLRRGGVLVALLIATGVVLSIVNAVIAAILAAARYLYGTARDRCWGARIDATLTAIHPRFGSPWLGTLLSGALMAVACLVPLPLLLVLSGASLLVIYGGIAAAVMVARHTGTSQDAPYHMPLYPVPPLVTLTALGIVLWANLLDAGQGRLALIATAVQIAGAWVYYRVRLRPRGWTVMLPEPERV